MDSKIGTGLKYYGRYMQTFGFIIISILTIVGTIFIAIKMNKYNNKSKADKESSIMNWEQVGPWVIGILWLLCILCGVLTLATYKSSKVAKVVGAFDLVNMMFNN